MYVVFMSDTDVLTPAMDRHAPLCTVMCISLSLYAYISWMVHDTRMCTRTHTCALYTHMHMHTNESACESACGSCKSASWFRLGNTHGYNTHTHTHTHTHTGTGQDLWVPYERVVSRRGKVASADKCDRSVSSIVIVSLCVCV